MDVRTQDQQEEAVALLKILALGEHDLEQGRFRRSDELFAELDAKDLAR